MKKQLIIILLLFGSVSFAQNFNKAKMDSLFAVIEQNNKGMANFSIFYDGEEIYNKSVGYADYAKKLKIDSNTKFRIGSISKTFTATIILQMVEEGKLKLDQSIEKYFKNLKNADKITIEMLLRHRSGIHNFTNDPSYLTWMQKPISRDSLVARVVAGGSDFDPNTKTAYSNSNFVLLSIIAEKIDKKSYDKILDKRVIKPLKLTRTNFGGKINTANDEALPYNFINDWTLSTETDVSVPLGAGAIVSTPHDLNIFLYALMHDKLISHSSLEKMKNMIDGLGLGLMQFPFNDKKAYGHGGSIDGFFSNVAYFENEKLGVAYCTNGVLMGMNDVLVGAMSIYFDLPYKLPVFKAAMQLSPEELEPYLGNYSCASFPLKITISKNNNTLTAQATGQSAFPLEAFEKDKFRFEPAGIEIDFTPGESKFILKQAGKEFEYIKE
jgi:D-alanyl-D-alanine carboxypeptidase